MERIICVAGPTASGKTALAVALARELDGEVISCDSMQVYRGMDIGTAKPTPEEMEGVPHHMLDVADPGEDFSVSRYCALAGPILEDILARGRTAVIAGGTGLYMDALIRGGDFAPSPVPGLREALEAQAQAEGMEAMLSHLREVDPETASRLHLSDKKRILRALEVYRQTGRTITEHNRLTQTVPPKYDPVYLGLTAVRRQDLYDRIDRRVEDMVARGLLEEIQGLLAAGVSRSATAMQAIGYKEFLSVLDGAEPLAQAVEKVQLSSRRYAKRQLTWFRRNPAMHWLAWTPEEPKSKIVARARQVLQESDSEICYHMGIPKERRYPYV